jgi:uncharacterized phage protein (TIGR01671 family)
MRVIKFRIFDIEENEMLYHDPELCSDFNVFTGEWCSYELPHLILMQYTGLKDKNGVEIYENDILRVTDDADEVDKLDSDTGIGVVEWLNKWCFWNVSGIENGLGDLNESGYLEVIGNIYQNPELLKGGKMTYSNCCGAGIHEEIGRCTECGEPCEAEE